MPIEDPSIHPKTDREKAIAAAAHAKAMNQRTGMISRRFGGFMEFVRTQGVVGLAVGLAIGSQASELVKTIVSSLITPIVDLIVGDGGLSSLTWTVHISGRSAEFTLGALVDALIRFIAIAFVVYFVVKGLKFDKLDQTKPKEYQ